MQKRDLKGWDWDSFQRIAITTQMTWTRIMALTYLRGVPGWFLESVGLLSVQSLITKGISAIFLVISFSFILLAP